MSRVLTEVGCGIEGNEGGGGAKRSAPEIAAPHAPQREANSDAGSGGADEREVHVASASDADEKYSLTLRPVASEPPKNGELNTSKSASTSKA